MSKRALGRWALLVGAIAVLTAWYALGLGEYLSFEALNANRVRLQTTVAGHPVLSVAVFMLIYVGVTAFSLPVATALTVMAGVLFGRWLGTLWVNLAATTGATLACLAARYLLRDWVQERLKGGRLDALNQGIARDGFNYLLFLRLLPVFPFFLVNLGAGLTLLPLRHFIIGTMVGTLPGTFLYVNAGHALGAISRPADLFSPALLASLALLGLFSLVPVVYKRWKQRRAARAARAAG
jgi:uncharacterized membrane protein YdjX (TVP38/TMEM64 family)